MTFQRINKVNIVIKPTNVSMRLSVVTLFMWRAGGCAGRETRGSVAGRWGAGRQGRTAATRQSAPRREHAPAAPRRALRNDGRASELMAPLVWWLAACWLARAATAGNPDAKRLYDDLLSNYNKLVRPVVNTTDVLRVCIKLKLSQLIDVVSLFYCYH